MNYCLNGVNPANPTNGGYEFLEWTGDVLHPGADLNAGWGDQDCGADVTAPVEIVIVKVLREPANGFNFGNHVWGKAGEDYLHFCHLSSILVREGDTVLPGMKVGLCGKTNGWQYCHLHFEVLKRKPSDWNQWVKGWSAQSILDYYYDPVQWLKEKESVNAEDQAIVDAVKAFGGGPASPESWVKAIGAWQERAGLLETELESVKDTNNRLLEENQTLHNQVDGLAERLSHVEEAVGSVVLVFKDGTRREINV